MQYLSGFNSFCERISLGGSMQIEPRMSENTASAKTVKIYEWVK